MHMGGSLVLNDISSAALPATRAVACLAQRSVDPVMYLSQSSDDPVQAHVLSYPSQRQHRRVFLHQSTECRFTALRF